MKSVEQFKLFDYEMPSKRTKSTSKDLDKKYGEGCDYFEGCEEEFETWLESKGEVY